MIEKAKEDSSRRPNQPFFCVFQLLMLRRCIVGKKKLALSSSLFFLYRQTDRQTVQPLSYHVKMRHFPINLGAIRPIDLLTEVLVIPF